MTSILRKLDDQHCRNLLILFTVGLFFWSSNASLLPTLPLYIESVGASKQQIGIIMGSSAIGLLLFRSKSGVLADKHSRKLVLLIGTVVAAITSLSYEFVQSIPLLIAIRAFQGMSIAAFTTGFSALVADLAPIEKRGEIIGYMSLTGPIGFAIGPAIGGYLQANDGYHSLFLISSGLSLVALLCTSQIINPSVNTQQQRDDSNNQFWQLFFANRVRVPAAIMFLFALAFSTVSSFVPLFIKSTQVEFNAGLFYIAAAVSSLSVRVLVSQVSDRLGRGLLVSLSLISYTLAMILLWNAHNTYTFLLAAFIEGAGCGILVPAITAIMADRSQPQERGRILGLCAMGWDLGTAIAGPMLGFVAEKVDYRNMFGFAAGLTLLAIVIFITQSSKSLRSSLRFAFGHGSDTYALKKQSREIPSPEGRGA